MRIILIAAVILFVFPQWSHVPLIRWSIIDEGDIFRFENDILLTVLIGAAVLDYNNFSQKQRESVYHLFRKHL